PAIRERTGGTGTCNRDHADGVQHHPSPTGTNGGEELLMTTLIKNLTDVETIFDQKSWVQDHDSHIEVCATSDHSFLLQISTSPHPLVLPRANSPAMVD